MSYTAGLTSRHSDAAVRQMNQYDQRPPRVSFLRRAAAYGIDSVIVLAIWFVALVLEIIVERALGVREEGDDAGTAFMIVFIALPLFWFLYQWTGNALGMSWGKRAVQLDIVRVTDFEVLPTVVRPGVFNGFSRTLGQALSAMAFGLGFWWALWDNGGQTWGDKMAGTRVIGGNRIPQPGDNLRFKYKEWSMSRNAWFLTGLGALLATILIVGGTEWWRILIVVSVIVANTAFTMWMAHFGNYVELRWNEIRFQSLQGRGSMKYSDIDNIAVSMDGKIELRFRSKSWLGRPKDQTTEFEIEGYEAFVEELEARVQPVQRRPLLVVH